MRTLCLNLVPWTSPLSADLHPRRAAHGSRAHSRRQQAHFTVVAGGNAAFHTKPQTCWRPEVLRP
jgi:hypothetical protein